jgi:hypothetical protein
VCTLRKKKITGGLEYHDVEHRNLYSPNIFRATKSGMGSTEHLARTHPTRNEYKINCSQKRSREAENIC